MSASEDYPIIFDITIGRFGSFAAAQARSVLAEIDSLRAELARYDEQWIYKHRCGHCNRFSPVAWSTLREVMFGPTGQLAEQLMADDEAGVQEPTITVAEFASSIQQMVDPYEAGRRAAVSQEGTPR